MDNGDGTITDSSTSLQWEKKAGTVGAGSDPTDPHNVNNTYLWCANGNEDAICDGGGVPDGSAFTSFLQLLNGGATGVGDCVSADGFSQTGGFANHCDWRLPTIAELQTILDTDVAGCDSPPSATPCIDPIFGPTVASRYWSSTTSVDANVAWYVGFGDVDVNGQVKTDGIGVRAVRGGPPD